MTRPAIAGPGVDVAWQVHEAAWRGPYWQENCRLRIERESDRAFLRMVLARLEALTTKEPGVLAQEVRGYLKGVGGLR